MIHARSCVHISLPHSLFYPTLCSGIKEHCFRAWIMIFLSVHFSICYSAILRHNPCSFISALDQSPKGMASRFGYLKISAALD